MNRVNTISPRKSYTSKISAIFSVTVLTFSLSISDTAFALNCYQKSPSFKHLGEKYFDEDYIQLSQAQRKQLSSLFKSLVGKWKGSIEEFECKGPDNSAHKIKHLGTAKAKISASKNSGLRIELEKSYQDERRLSSEVLKPFNKTIIRSIDLSKHRIHTSETFRSPTDNNNSIFIENSIFISLFENKMAIELIRYVNGHYISNAIMRLEK